MSAQLSYRAGLACLLWGRGRTETQVQAQFHPVLKAYVNSQVQSTSESRARGGDADDCGLAGQMITAELLSGPIWTQDLMELSSKSCRDQTAVY